MRIVALPSNYDGAGYYRVLFPVREMALRGHQVIQTPRVVEPLPGGLKVHYGVFQRAPDGVRLVKGIDQWLLDEDFELLVLNQRDEGGWADVLARLRGQGKRVLVDSDDDWLNLPVTNPGHKRTPQARRLMLDTLEAADGLTCATPALAALYAPYQPNVSVIRNKLDWGMWADTPLAYEQEHRRVRVGWMGDSRWRMGDLAILRGVIGPWLEQHPEVEFVAAGDPTVHDILGVPHSQRVSIMPTHFHELDLADITAVMDIGLVPLRKDRFNESKSHLKGLEYAACGIPCIAAPTESYRWWVEPGVNGLLADPTKPRQWREALEVALGAWRDMGRAARLKASEHVIQGAGADEWESVYLGDHADASRERIAA